MLLDTIKFTYALTVLYELHICSTLLLNNSDDEDCPECDEIMNALEQIDGEADLFGIDFVKVSSPEAAERYNIINVPSLVYFRKKTPLIYDGDLTQEDKILQWLTSQDVFEIKNEIEEVNKKMLDKLLDENEFLAVFFCESIRYLQRAILVIEQYKQ